MSLPRAKRQMNRQSLKRMKLDYVDVFYSHRYDPNTPIEETMQALVDIVRSGKALYAGISNYPHEAAETAFRYPMNFNFLSLPPSVYRIFDIRLSFIPESIPEIIARIDVVPSKYMES